MSVVQQSLQVTDGIESDISYKVKNIHAKKGSYIYKGKKIIEILKDGDKYAIPIKAKLGGMVVKMMVMVGDRISVGNGIIEVEACAHPTVLGNICCDCGEVLDEAAESSSTQAKSLTHVSMLHALPDLKVSREEATRLGREDLKHLLDKRKLVLVVDLDQTLIHTTNDNIPPNLKDVFHFQLVPNGPWYHTRLRPYTRSFLKEMSALFELHICTFGVREYAHCIARFLDPTRELFADRILSRNECLDPLSKTANLSSLFPCGDNLVCIIDDRSDVWNFAPNVVQVLPYHFFQHTGDINAPPGLQKKEKDDTSTGFDFSSISNTPKSEQKAGQESDSEQEGSAKRLSSTSKPQDPTNQEDSAAPAERPDRRTSHKIETTGESSSESFSSNESTSNGEENEISSSKTQLGQQTSKSVDSDKAKKSDECEKSPKSELIINGKVESKEDNCYSNQIQKDVSSKDRNPDDSISSTASSDLPNAEDSPKPQNEDGDVLDVDDSDDYLMYLEDILKKLHEKFYNTYIPSKTDKDYEQNLPDLKQIVPEVKSNVLKGVNLVFSSVVPHHVTLQASKAYNIAISLGAGVTDKIIPKKTSGKKSKSDSAINYTTHLVTANFHTEKVHLAKRLKNIKIVSPNWLWSCVERWEWVDERLFSMSEYKEGGVFRDPPLHCLVHPATRAKFQKDILKINEPGATAGSSNNSPLIESLNPFAFFSNDETKSMEDEVDDLLSDDEEYRISVPKGKSLGEDESSFSGQSSSDEFDVPDEESDDETGRWNAKKRKRPPEDDDDQDVEEDDDDEDLPSIRFRQGGDLPSDQSDQESGDDDMDAYGDILERELMRD